MVPCYYCMCDMVKMKNIYTLCFCLLGALFLQSCKQEENSHILHIGFLTPQTGNDALAGTSCARGAKIAEDFLKKQNIQAKITIVDTESNVEAARLKTQKLIKKGVHCIIGTFNSAVSAAVAEIAEKNKIPFIINLSAADQITEQGYQYVFRNFPTATMFTQKSVQLLSDLLKISPSPLKTATLIVLNDPYGQGMLDALKAAEKNKTLPFELTNIIQFDYKTKDLSNEVAKAKSFNNDIFLVVSRSNTTNMIIREMINQKFHPKIIIGPANQGFFEKQFFSIFQNNANYIYTLHAWINPVSPLTKDALEIFSQAYPEEIFELNAAFSLEAIYIAAKAFNNMTNQKLSSLQEALQKINEKEGIMFGGNIQFDQNGQRQTLELVALMNKDQKPLITLPETAKETDCVIPFPGFNEKSKN